MIMAPRNIAMNLHLTLLQIMAQIKMLTGVVEVGLFCHMAKAAYFGNEVSGPTFTTFAEVSILAE